MAKIIVSACLALALWVTGGFFAFLLLPLVSDLPLGSGALAGLFAFIAQLLWGQALVKRLLRWQDGKRPGPELNGSTAIIASDCPQVLYLQGLCCTQGATTAEIPAALIEEWRQVGPTLAECFYLNSMLAVPCLLRAFEAVTNAYGKLRLSEGPLWYLGRFFAFWARILEWPLRCCWGEQRPACALAERLSAELRHCEKVPAWLRALDLVSPLSVSQVVRHCRWERGQEQLKEEERSVRPARFSNPNKYVIGGVLLGAILALSPLGYWGALPLGLGLGLLGRFIARYPQLAKACELKEAWAGRVESPRALAVRERGRIEQVPAQMAFDRVRWCWRGASGIVALGRVPHRVPLAKWAEEGTEIEMQGWLDSERVVLQVEAFQSAEGRYRDFYRWKYGGWPILLAGCGAAWWYLQIIGL